MLDSATHEEMRYVFLHELAHLKRRDIYLGWLTSLLQILHWFNPLVWLAFHRMRTDRELACDALVLTQTGQERSHEYGGAIVGLLRRFSRSRRLPAMAGIVENRSQLRRRIAMITRFKKNSYQWSPLAVIVIIMLGCVSLPDAQRKEATVTSAAKPAHKPNFRKIRIPTKPKNGILSPDGNKLAFMSDEAVWVVPLHGKVDPDIAGEPVRLAEVPGIWDNGSLMAWSTDGEWIAVNTLPDAEDVFVHVIPAAGGEPRVVQMPKRGSHSWSYRLSLSPDGQMLAFSARELHKPRQKTSDAHDRYICTIPTAGGEPKQVSSGWGRMPSFSPDGETIAYVDEVRKNWQETERYPLGGELWIVPSEGGTPVKLATVEGRLRGPVWSPDGKYIAAHHEPGVGNDSKEIWVFPLSSDASSAGEPEKIALPHSSWNMLAGWTPGGQLGVFLAPEAHWAGYTVPASGGKAVQIIPESTLFYPRWSPDGERIYFRGEDDENALVSYVPAAGGNVGKVPLQIEQFNSTVPGGGHNISPDGKRIVMSASHDIWVITLDGGLPTRLTNDDSHETYPCWSPDGEWVAFVDEVNYAIYIVPAGGGEIRQVSSESDRLGSGAITFSPDGELIAFLSGGSIKTIPVEGGEPTILVGKVKSGYHSQLAYSPDGSKIAHNVGAEGKIWITPLDGGGK
jgi:Tol biopolymer transport system component